jgi:hypothetical protein
MMRTTLDIDTPVLDELRRLQKRPESASKSLGKLVSELLTEALARRGGEVGEAAGFAWISQPMRARVDLEDKEAVQAALDAEG